MITITFPRTRVCQFYKENPDWMKGGLVRFGQAFHDFMQLEKVHGADNREFCERLYQADSLTAQRMVIERTDWDN